MLYTVYKLLAVGEAASWTFWVMMCSDNLLGHGPWTLKYVGKDVGQHRNLTCSTEYALV